jgi:hypothetical protein
MRGVPAAIEAHARIDLNPERAFEGKLQTPQGGNQLVAGADARAAALEPGFDALEHGDVPTDAPQPVRGEEAAD